MTDTPSAHPLLEMIPVPEDEEEGPTYVILTSEQWEENQAERQSDRRSRLVQMILLAIAVGVGVYGAWNAFQEAKERTEAEKTRIVLVRNNQRILENIEAQTSPEAQAARQEQLDAIILTVDCNNRQATEEAINQLARQLPDVLRNVTLTDGCTE